MALFEVARRTIENFGILKFTELSESSQGSIDEWTRVEVWGVLRRRQINPYMNLEWNPNRGFYGRCTIAAENTLGTTHTAIIHECRMEYEIQRLYEWKDESRIINAQLCCATQKILESIAALGAALSVPVLTINPLPTVPSTKFPGELLRFSCESDCLVDIVLLVENAFEQALPPDLVCSQFQIPAVPDELPSGTAPGNDLDDTPDPSDDPQASPPYDPITRDQEETPNDNIPPALPGQRGRICFNGTVATCQDAEPYAIDGCVSGFIPPISASVVPEGVCTSMNAGKPTFAIVVRDGLGQDNFVLTTMWKVPGYTLSYYTP